jgi:hypothetical protein
MSVPQFTAAASLYNFTYILQPGDPADPQILIESLRPTSQPWHLVVGRRGPIASPELCNGLMIPIVISTRSTHSTRESSIKSIPRAEKITAKEVGPDCRGAD